MKVIFSPTKTMKIVDNDWIKSVVGFNDQSYAINNRLNCIKNSNYNQAIFFYNGISYKYLDVKTLNNDYLSYLEANLSILSALYGVLKPSNLICEYRLDFTANKELYGVWSDIIVNEFQDEQLIVNLASKEYSLMLKKINQNKIVNIEFRSIINEKVVNKATYSKIARGLMLRYMAVNQVLNLEDLKDFKEYEYQFNAVLSNENNMFFTREEK